MSLNLKEDEDQVYGRIYNVELEMGNGRLTTFSNILRNADGKYFWFSSKERGLTVVKQDRVTLMYATEDKTE